MREWIVEEFYDELDKICLDAIELMPSDPNFLENIPTGHPFRIGRYFELDGGRCFECNPAILPPPLLVISGAASTVAPRKSMRGYWRRGKVRFSVN